MHLGRPACTGIYQLIVQGKAKGHSSGYHPQGKHFSICYKESMVLVILQFSSAYATVASSFWTHFLDYSVALTPWLKYCRTFKILDPLSLSPMNLVKLSQGAFRTPEFWKAPSCWFSTWCQDWTLVNRSLLSVLPDLFLFWILVIWVDTNHAINIFFSHREK